MSATAPGARNGDDLQVNPKHHAAFHAEVVALLADIDPIGLVAIGAPRDEYEPEVADLVRHRPPSPRDVQEVFLRWFGDGVGAINESVAARIAKGVASLQASHLG